MSNSVDLESCLNKLLTQQLLKRSVRVQGKLNTTAILKFLEEKKVLPKYICQKIAEDLIEFITYRHQDIIPHSDRHSGLGWSTQNIHLYIIQNLNKYLQELFQEIQKACEEIPLKND